MATDGAAPGLAPGSATVPTRLVIAGWAVVAGGLTLMAWCEVRLHRAGRGDIGVFGLDDLPYLIAVVVSAVTGGMLLLRVHHPVGWALMGIAVAIMTTGLAQAYGGYGGVVHPGALPAAAWVAALYNVPVPLILALIALIALLTPTGRLGTRGARAVAAAVVVGAATWSLHELIAEPVVEIDAAPNQLLHLPNPWFADPIAGSVASAIAWTGTVVLHLGFLAASVDLVRRFRRARGIERQQLRWVAYGAAAAAVAIVAAFAAARADRTVLLTALGGVIFAVLPVAITLAISRYRLYDLDRIVSRSVLLLILIVTVGAVYAVVVAALGALGGSDRVAGGIAAIAAALAVAPLRARVERWVDRALFGRRRDPFAVVSDLNRRLQASASPQAALQELADTIAVDLHLPYVAVESFDGTALAAHGQPEPSRTLRMPLVRGHRDVGALVLGLRRGEDAFDEREQALLADIAGHAGAAVEAAVLVHDLQRSQRRLVTAREEERRRLRRDLHDGLGPQLTAVTLKVDAARNLLTVDPTETDRVLGELRTDVRTAIDDIRRLVYALRPPGLDELGLLGALRQQAHSGTSATGGPEVAIAGNDIAGLPAPVEVAAYRIATEAITNTIRHASARHCRVEVQLDGDLTITVSDDGIGMPVGWTAGVGITSMRERAAELGGTCAIDATPAGTTVTAALPVDVADPPDHAVDAETPVESVGSSR